ncbi:hypothetical protein ACFVYG_08740 [Streptomyces sp. NPDC058256]|uniref:hypothetical protein n=1 Tax=Streptomyces sp. NPDC058256 TaxID=3346408 RepID=UPI0036E8675E
MPGSRCSVLAADDASTYQFGFAVHLDFELEDVRGKGLAQASAWEALKALQEITRRDSGRIAAADCWKGTGVNPCGEREVRMFASDGFFLIDRLPRHNRSNK